MMNNYMNIIKSITAVAVCALAFTSCHNSDWEFDDYGTTTAYFAMQAPIRVITLGEDNEANVVDDNNHQFHIYATFAGVYKNNAERKLKYIVDPTLLEGVDGVELLPADYYTIQDPSTLTIPSGAMWGGTVVTLNDKFFADPKSAKVNYVLPVRITGIEANVDSVLEGRDYQLLAITYKNKHDGLWAYEGTDLWNEKSRTFSHKYTDPLVEFTTTSLNGFSLTKSFTVMQKVYDAKKDIWEDKEASQTKTFNCTVADNGDIVVYDENGNQAGTGKYTYHGADDFTKVDTKVDFITLKFSVTLTSEVVAGPAEWHYDCTGSYMLYSRGNSKENWK